MTEAVSVDAEIEEKIRKRIETLKVAYLSRRDSITHALGAVQGDDLERIGPYVFGNCSVSFLDETTVQIGTLRQVLLEILEIRKSRSDSAETTADPPNAGEALRLSRQRKRAVLNQNLHKAWGHCQGSPEYDKACWRVIAALIEFVCCEGDAQDRILDALALDHVAALPVG